MRSWGNLRDFFLLPQQWVVRGGSFLNPPELLRSANRFNVLSVGRNDYRGFRCVRVPPPAS